MATAAMGEVIQHLRRTALLRGGAGLTDAQLLDDYVSRRDEAALEALVHRHGPMVWCVCRRVLDNQHDAEDAFQATFLVFVRKAASIASRELLAAWLHGVAYQTARKARATAFKRHTRERQVTEMPEPALEHEFIDDLQPLIDQELSQLSDKYRKVLILCDLEGKTRKDAARQLRCPEGTVASRLATARAMLAKRLARHGVTISGGALAAVLSQGTTSAGVPTSVVSSTIKAATLFAAGRTGAISVKVAALAEGVLKTMLFSKLKTAIAIVLILGFVVTGATVLTCRTAAGQDDKKPAAEKPVEPAAKSKKEPVTAWGKEVDGLQLGLALVPADAHAFGQGETIKLAVRLRNVGKAEVTVVYQWLRDCPPQVATDAGGRVTVYMPRPQWEYRGYALPPVKLALKPGKTITLYNPVVAVESPARAKLFGEMRPNIPTICVEPGTYKIAFGPMLQSHPKLTTGTVEFEVKDRAAWGKEIGGLQAGVSLRPDEKRVYRHGDVITLAVRVRNVGKEAVKFEYVRQFLDEELPTVTDADGKTVRQLRIAMLGFHVPMEVTLEPGKEIELESRLPLQYQLRPADDGGKPTGRTLTVGTGKISLQYERVFGSSSSGKIKLDPALSKLATGKLELEVELEKKK
jgi:RNA polymerase sigma factor (sigma-70 family)